MLIIGLMTGTSMDGIDACLIEAKGRSLKDLEWRIIKSSGTTYPDQRRDEIHRAMLSGGTAEICRLHADMGEWLADASLKVCEEAGLSPDEVDLIGSHGQTVWHAPPEDGRRGATLQLGCPSTIAERTGISVISDFRSRDMAAGGHGAPLVPWVDRVIFALPNQTRALQNIGGIGNVTLVPPSGTDRPLLAFDTGPGNALIDAAVELASGDRLHFDRDGVLASQGRVDQALLDELMGHPYFEMPPPKSTGRELFGRPMVQRLVEAIGPEGDQDWLDLIATLTELTARSIADAYRKWLLSEGVDEIVVSGGGALNPTLMGRIEELLAPVPVRGADALSIEATEKEALAFAILAWAHVHGIPANEPGATGADGPRILGSFTPGRKRDYPWLNS